MDSEVLTVEELCVLLRIHRSTAYRLIRKRLIPNFKIGSDYRFTRSAIDDWMLRAQINLEGGK